MDTVEISRECLLGGYGKIKVLTPEGDELEIVMVEREVNQQTGDTTVWFRTELA